ncbi:uncharacterized protein LOC130993248 [Salvia miltiorrhiza]|uniref:uncharacterized protein LOC130993248 n=1 Tax=Salvia miltiorrhiza TaxID=226208 RepID=UPI0025AD87E3|nr:uncharacterized protein LOC130993248 [Salvia miltiorrhiza]
MKISGRVVSTKPISLSRAAKLISRFAAVENGSSPAVSLYLQRTSNAFNLLVQSQDKRSKTKSAMSLDSKENINDVKSDGDAPPKKKKKRKSGEAEKKSGSKKSRDEALDS